MGSPEDTLYVKYVNDRVNAGTTFDGWYVGNTENPSTYYISLDKKIGAGNLLYFPKQGSLNGYWLASPSACGINYIMQVICKSPQISGCYSSIGASYFTFRPIISLPTSIVNQ